VVIELIQQQIGLAVLPRSALAGTARVTQLALTRSRIHRRLVLVWRSAGGSPAARAFLALARQHLTG